MVSRLCYENKSLLPKNGREVSEKTKEATQNGCARGGRGEKKKKEKTRKNDVIMRLPRFIILSSLLVCYLPELSGSAGSDTLHGEVGGDAHELFPRVPLVKWAHITTSWDEEDAPFNSRSEGYHEIVEIISDVSEIVAVPERLNDVKQMLRSVGRCLTSHGVNYVQSIAFLISEYAIVY